LKLTPPRRLSDRSRRPSAVLRSRNGGLPNLFPLDLALRRPALTRSAIRDLSSSATAPRTVKTIFPVGVLVSTCSESDTNSTPRALKVVGRFRDLGTARLS